MNYAEKLKDPRWQKKRLEIFERDNWKCQWCNDEDSTLNIHHLRYIPGCDPWEYHDSFLLTLCDNCHETDHENRQHREKELLETLKLASLDSGDICMLEMCFSGWDIIFNVDENVYNETYDQIKLNRCDKSYLFQEIYKTVDAFIEIKRKEKHGDLKLSYTINYKNNCERILNVLNIDNEIKQSEDSKALNDSKK